MNYSQLVDMTSVTSFIELVRKLTRPNRKEGETINHLEISHTLSLDFQK